MHLGSPTEYLYPITIIESLALLLGITYVTAAICQRWQLLIEATGFISFPSYSSPSLTIIIIIINHNQYHIITLLHSTPQTSAH